MHVHESMQLMKHGVELLDFGSTGHYIGHSYMKHGIKGRT
jgi:hypothetical protein